MTEESKALVAKPIEPPHPLPIPAARALMFGTDNPREIVARASEIAKVLKDVVTQQGLISRIGNKDYLQLEAWTFLGQMAGGFTTMTAWSRPLMDGETCVGYEARVEVIDSFGTVRGGAEAQCLRSEGNWKKRDSFALRSMAQTRAAGKALRGVLGFIAVLAGYEGCPEEDMPQSMPRQKMPSPAQGAAEMGAAFDEDIAKSKAEFAEFQALCLALQNAKTVEDVERTEAALDAPTCLVKDPKLRQQVHKKAGAVRAEFARAEKAASGAKPKATPADVEAHLKSLNAARSSEDLDRCVESMNRFRWSKIDRERLGDKLAMRRTDFELAGKEQA